RPFALLRGPMRNKGPMLDPLAAIGLGGLALLVLNVHILELKGEDGLHADPLLFRGGLFLTGVFTVLLIAAVAHQRAWSGRLLGNVVLRSIGERSYGLYLYHWPVFQALRHETGVSLKVHEFVAAMIVTALITEFSYRVIELPVRERRFRASMSALLSAGPGAVRRRGAFAAMTAAIVAIPAFSAVSLATADLKLNRVAATLDQASGSVTDVLQAVGQEGGEGEQPSGSTTSFVPPRYEIFALGDSVMRGAAPALKRRGMVVDAVEDRQGKIGAEIFVQLKDLGVTMDAAVVHLGTNGPISRDTLDVMMEALSDVPRVVVLTNRANREWTASNNAKIRELVDRYPNVAVLDWQLVAELCTGECFTADGIHLDSDGMTYYADEILKAVRGS
ncbi:MAG: acyltransferase family protein, partial [Actinomycetota bacterium]